ncbi:hypothetical protein [Planococcus lenghuensis]|nr:hypothetical protein [Planococcus lenghuensis]
MKDLSNEEQILIAYYVQYYRGASAEEIEKLHEQLRNEIGEETYDKALQKLKDRGRVSGLEKVKENNENGTPIPMATNDGILAINTLFEITSDSAEESQLYYLENNLKTSGFQFTLNPVKQYVEEAFRKEAEKEPNQNRP